MINKTIFVIVIATICIFISCRNSSNDKSKILTDKKSMQDEIKIKIDLQTIDSLPIQSGTCPTCFFSKNEEEFKKGNYIWIDNTTGQGFMKINGKLEEFGIQEGFVDDRHINWLSENNKYELDMILRKIANNGRWTEGGYIPSQIFTGSIRLKSLDDTLNLNIYGECGCLK